MEKELRLEEVKGIVPSHAWYVMGLRLLSHHSIFQIRAAWDPKALVSEYGIVQTQMWLSGK